MNAENTTDAEQVVLFSTTPATEALLNESDGYPRQGFLGTVAGFGLNRDRLIAILQECTPSLSSISAIPHHVKGGDLTSFEITVYVSFARSELEVAS